MRHCFNLVDFGCRLLYAYFLYQWVPCVASGHTAGYQAHEAPASVFSPGVRRVQGLKLPNQLSNRVVEAGTLGFPWLHTKLCRRSKRCHNCFCTSCCRPTQPCITAP